MTQAGQPGFPEKADAGTSRPRASRGFLRKQMLVPVDYGPRGGVGRLQLISQRLGLMQHRSNGGGRILPLTAVKVSRKEISDLTRRVIPCHLFLSRQLRLGVRGLLRGKTAMHLPRMDAKALKGGDE